MSNFEDAQCFLKFVEETFLEQEKTCSDGMNYHLACEPADGGRLNTSEQKAGAINVSVVSKTSRVGSRLGKEGCESDEQVSGTKNMKPEVGNGPVADGRCSGDKLGGWHQNSVAQNGPEVREAAMSDSVDFSQIVLERICLYPIKSCGAFKVNLGIISRCDEDYDDDNDDDDDDDYDDDDDDGDGDDDDDDDYDDGDDYGDGDQ